MKITQNLRTSLESLQVDYIAALRDEAIQTAGICVGIKTPKKENNLDEYINYTDKNKDDFYYSESFIVPKFKEYRQILSKLGNTAEENYTLECAIPSALHLPRNSRVILNEYDSNENKVVREWRVLSTVTKQLSNSKSYTRLAYLVPDRTSILNTAKVETSVCYISYNHISDILITSGNYANCIVKVLYSVNNKQKFDNDITAETTCTIKWKVQFPSILY